MYKEHEQLEAVLDDIVLWKYMDFLKFVNILTTNQIWFNKINNISSHSHFPPLILLAHPHPSAYS